VRRDEGMRSSVALDDAKSLPSFWYGVCAARSGEWNDDAVWVQNVNSCPVHLPVAGGLRHVINAATRDVPDAGGDVIGTGGRAVQGISDRNTARNFAVRFGASGMLDKRGDLYAETQTL
jgi:hypothetical protein